MDQITFECISGYELASGDLVRNCTSDALWDGAEPMCTSKIKFCFCCVEFLWSKRVVFIDINCGDL